MRFNLAFKGLNGLVHFAERRNLFSGRVPSHFKRSLINVSVHMCCEENLQNFEKVFLSKVTPCREKSLVRH